MSDELHRPTETCSPLQGLFIAMPLPWEQIRRTKPVGSYATSPPRPSPRGKDAAARAPHPQRRLEKTRSLARTHARLMIHDRGRAGGRTGVLIDERDGSGEKSRSRRRAG